MLSGPLLENSPFCLKQTVSTIATPKHSFMLITGFKFSYSELFKSTIPSFKMTNKCLSVALLFRVVLGATLQCSLTEVKMLLEGCERLIGLNVTSVGGTIVNDHNCDVLLPKQVFIEEPLFQYNLADSKKFYTLIMVDPDAPPQLEGEFYLHMVKSNIPGLALKAKESSKTVGIDYRAYKPPTPPRGTGQHRYIMMLYEQADGNNFLPTVPSSRHRFILSKWLVGKNLCGPVAGIQFKSEF